MISSTASFPPSCRKGERVNSLYACARVSLVSFLVSFGVLIMGFDASIMVFGDSNMDIDQREIPHTYAGKIKKRLLALIFKWCERRELNPSLFAFLCCFFVFWCLFGSHWCIIRLYLIPAEAEFYRF